MVRRFVTMRFWIFIFLLLCSQEWEVACWAQIPSLPSQVRIPSNPEDLSTENSLTITRLKTVTVTADNPNQSSFERSTAITTVKHDELVRQSPALIPHVLRDQPGGFVQETTPGQTSPIIRGLIGSSVLMLVDGMRLNSAIFRPAPNQYFGLVDPQNIQHLDLIRGGVSALYGSDAIGGVVQVTTPTPHFDTDEWSVRGKATGRFGSAAFSRMGRLALETGKKGIAFSSGVTHQHFDDLRGGGDIGTQRPSGYESFAWDGKIFIDQTHQDFLINIQYLKQPHTPRFDQLVAGFGQSQPSAAVFFFEPNDRLFVHMRYRLFRPVAFWEELIVNLAFQEINDDRRIRDFGSLQENREENRDRLIGMTLQMKSRIGDVLKLTYGGQIYLDTVNSGTTSRNIMTGVTSTPQSRFANGSTLNNYAGYVHGAWTPYPRLTVFLGSRVSHFAIDIPQADRTAGTQLSLTEATGNVGILYRLTPEVHLVTNGGRAFRVPNVFDLSTLGARPGNRFNIPNPNLGPERAITIDAGFKVQSARLTGELLGFYSTIDGKIDSVPTGATTAEGRQVVQNANLSTVNIYGMETGWTLRFFEQWKVFNTLTLTWGEEQLTTGQVTPADRIPPAHGRLGMGYQSPQSFWIEAFLRYAFRQDRLSARDKTDPRINPEGTPGWVTVSLRSGWDMWDWLRGQVILENILDHPYREHGSGIDASGFNGEVSLTAEFL